MAKTRPPSCARSVVSAAPSDHTGAFRPSPTTSSLLMKDEASSERTNGDVLRSLRRRRHGDCPRTGPKDARDRRENATPDVTCEPRYAMVRAMNFADRLAQASRLKESVVVLGIDPQLDAPGAPGIPLGYTLARFCCEIVEACARSAIAVKPQLAFYEARGLEGMRAFCEVAKLARKLGLMTIADAKRGDIGTTSAAYAEAFLGDGDFSCDAVTVNPYQGSDALMPFLARVKNGRGVFVLVKTSNPSSGEFQDLHAPDRPIWEWVAERVNGWGSDFIGASGLSSVGAVVGATYPVQARRARELMPAATILVPGYETQGASAADAVASARADGTGFIVNASRSLMYAYQKTDGAKPVEAAAEYAESMRLELTAALATRRTDGLARTA
jgi:orotidine-5'-phosphate decarboxylase